MHFAYERLLWRRYWVTWRPRGAVQHSARAPVAQLLYKGVQKVHALGVKVGAHPVIYALERERTIIAENGCDPRICER